MFTELKKFSPQILTTGEDHPEIHRNRNNKVSDSNKYETLVNHLLAREYHLVFLLLLFVPDLILVVPEDGFKYQQK